MSRSTRSLSAAAFAVGLMAAAAPAANAVNTDSLGGLPADCEVDVANVAEETPGPFDDEGWTVGEHSNLCGNLGFLVLETEGGTVTSPTKVLLYHHGKQVATQPADEGRVLVGGHSDFHVALRFQQPPADDEANADAGYLTTVYVWNPFAGDGDATPIGPLPAGITF